MTEITRFLPIFGHIGHCPFTGATNMDSTRLGPRGRGMMRANLHRNNKSLSGGLQPTNTQHSEQHVAHTECRGPSYAASPPPRGWPTLQLRRAKITPTCILECHQSTLRGPTSGAPDIPAVAAWTAAPAMFPNRDPAPLASRLIHDGMRRPQSRKQNSSAK